MGLLAAVFVTGSAQAQDSARPSNAFDRPLGVQTAQSEALVDAARRLTFDYRLNAATDSLRLLAGRPDGRMAAYHGLLTIALYQGFVTEDPAYFDRFAATADTLDRVLDDAPPGPWREHVAAERKLMEAMVAGRRGSYLSAAWKARSAYRSMRDLAEGHPAFADPLLGLGLIHVTVATLPSSYQFALGVLGFDGDTDRGLRELDRAAETSQTNRFAARVVRAVFDLMVFQESERGRQRLAELRADTPESQLLAYLYAYALISDRKTREARRVLASAIEASKRPGYAYVDFLDYFYGYVLFVDGDYEAAARTLRRYLGRHRGDALRSTASLYVALAVEMEHGHDAAEGLYRQVRVYRKFDPDRWAARWAEKRAARPMTERERTLLLGRNAFDSGRYERARELLRPILDAPQAPAHERAEAAYRLGRVAHVQGRLRDALNLYERAAANPGDRKAKWGPWSLLYAGDVHRSQGRPEAARQAYDAALRWPEPFDYADALEQSAKIGLRALEASMR
jgi:tetratricopeptide (TPR) repeat protein